VARGPEIVGVAGADAVAVAVTDADADAAVAPFSGCGGAPAAADTASAVASDIVAAMVTMVCSSAVRSCVSAVLLGEERGVLAVAGVAAGEVSGRASEGPERAPAKRHGAPSHAHKCSIPR